MADSQFQVVVIGSGPGGYVAAIRCAQLGLKTAIIEKYSTLGGTCLNVGCIPSKALLDSSEHYHQALHQFSAHGIETGKLQLDLAKMIQRKNEVVKSTCDGVSFLMKKNKIQVFTGTGSFINNKEIKVTNSLGEAQTLIAEKVIIATGSKPISLPGVTLDKTRIITSTEALNLPEVPKHLIIIGGGVIGLELGSVYARLGAKVSVVEYTEGLIPSMDKSLGKELQKILKTQLGFEFYFHHKVTSAEVKKKEVIVTAESTEGKKLELTGDYCLVSVGRRPYTQDLELENIKVSVDERGRIPVNESLETDVKGIYAIGDVVRGAMLAHKASDEGVFVAEKIAGQKPHIQYHCIPNVVYTWPEVAGVGYTEEELKGKGIKFKTGTFPFKALGRARPSMDTEGFVKVIADAETDELLGVHGIGARMADIIAEAVVALEFRASAEDLAMFSHAHPTYTEAVKEAALGATGNRYIHL